MSVRSNPRSAVEVYPGEGQGTYGPVGFTRRPAVAAMLTAYEVGGAGSDVVAFDGVPHYIASQLLAMLPPSQADVAAGLGPSFAELIEATADCPSARFSGYRVLSPRPDERVVLDGFQVHAKDMSESLRSWLDDAGPCIQIEDGFLLVIRWQ
jgi:hypothetical protein